MDIERRNLSGNEYAALQALFCVISTFAETSPRLEKRAKKARPGTWRDIRMIQSAAARVLDNLLETIPPEKLAHVRADIQHTKLYIRIEPDWAAPTVSTKGFSYTPTQTLNDLLNYLVGNECMFCTKSAKEARKCIHRKTIEDALPHSVPGGDNAECKFAGIALGLDDSREE